MFVKRFLKFFWGNWVSADLLGLTIDDEIIFCEHFIDSQSYYALTFATKLVIIA